ncbi:MAG: hypothetical protein R3F29_13975 [Planctomycetota bacterium]
MKTTKLLLAAACLGAPLAAQFADPVLLHAGKKPLGNKRLYPSPTAHDIDGDGRLDYVIGDLPGRLTYALRLPGDAIAFGPEQKLQDAAGAQLDFGNW